MESHVDGMTDLISQSLDLSFPWYVREIKADYDNHRVDVYVDTHDLIEMECPDCGRKCRRAGYEKNERVWQHGDVWFTPTYVHCRRPRVRCPEHGAKVVLAPWARKKSTLTYFMESYALELMKDLPKRKAARILRCSEKSLEKALKYWVEKAVAEDNLSRVRRIAVDETSFKKGQSYVTVVIDADERRVIDVEEGRSAEAIERFSLKLEEKHGDCNRIDTFCSDMSPAYKSGCEMCFPRARLVIDKFHVKQLLMKGMDEVRRAEQGKSHKSLQSGKKLLMIPETRMREDQREALKKLSMAYPKTGRSFRMIQVLDEMFACRTESDARAIFKRLISWMKRSKLEPMKKIAKSLQNRAEDILEYFRARVTNAIAEGINSMIQAAKRKARGYKTVKGYVSMIYLIAGKLRLSCPSILF